MKSLYLIFGLWILIGCFQSGEGVRGPRRQHNPRRPQDLSTLRRYFCLQSDPNGVQMEETTSIPLTIQPPSRIIDLPGILTIITVGQLGTIEYHCQLTGPHPGPLSNPPTQLHSTE
ncbi:variable coding sequence A2 precursor [Rattus norvegicus]|uniref:SMR1-alpha2 n=1 Tax=Rattus norvegicus TaxID=10116 RepID=P70676_RAT|nr:variable coding sequence A2 precursor [Rattus norvegicus]CAA54830.1 SMR1-alpha2 [Rattus norvegicus]CAA54832.1 SMR1-alpha2 [Rattus norvegicus]|eukprot:NP_942024.1 variable coding sequence A2 precursor [Rattus norvegicus]